jgi:hypothetical protein
LGTFSDVAPSTTPVNAVYAKAIFQDSGVDTVTLTMKVLPGILPAGAYVPEWYFNSTTAPLNSITHFSGDTASSVGNTPNTFKADGTGGKFDILFKFPVSNPGQIGQGQQSVYTLTDTGLTANSFNSLSVPAPNGGGYLGAIKVQGYGKGNSAWIAAAPVPEPKSYAMLLAGLGLVGFSARRRMNNKA